MIHEDHEMIHLHEALQQNQIHFYKIINICILNKIIIINTYRIWQWYTIIKYFYEALLGYNLNHTDEPWIGEWGGKPNSASSCPTANGK